MRQFHFRRRLASLGRVAACLGALVILAGTEPAGAFSALVTFGDSYTDTGNAPSSPPAYYDGRFSNGPLWVEYLSTLCGFYYDPLNNYAVSGSETDELGLQIANFPGTSDSDGVLFCLWSGNNDFYNHLSLGSNDSAWNTQINHTVSSLTTAADLLYQKGARRLVLFNQIDITRLPSVLTRYTTAFRNYIRSKITLCNSRLSNALPSLLAAHPGLEIYRIDAYANFNYLLDYAPDYGFTQATLGALNDPSLADKTFAGPGANYVFWDNDHPTTKAHRIITDWVVSQIGPLGDPPTIAITHPANGAAATAPADIPISIELNPNGATIAAVDFYQNSQWLGQSATAPYSFTWSAVPAGTYHLTAQVTYGAGQTVTSSSVTLTVTAPVGQPVPPPWLDQDIGAVAQPGSAFDSTDGAFLVSASGADIWNNSDQFHFVYRTWSGDGAIVAQVAALANTDPFAKAGVMFRQTLEPGAANVLQFVTPTSGAGFQSRANADGLSTYTPGPALPAPAWVKLERVGNTFSGYASADGTAWSLVGTTTLALPATLYAGLALSAHNNSVLGQAAFADIQLLSTRPVLSLTRQPDGTVILTVTGQSGATYEIQASSDLATWTPLTTVLATAGLAQVTDPTAPASSHRYYRARWLP